MGQQLSKIESLEKKIRQIPDKLVIPDDSALKNELRDIRTILEDHKKDIDCFKAKFEEFKPYRPPNSSLSPQKPTQRLQARDKQNLQGYRFSKVQHQKSDQSDETSECSLGKDSQDTVPKFYMSNMIKSFELGELINNLDCLDDS